MQAMFSPEYKSLHPKRAKPVLRPYTLRASILNGNEAQIGLLAPGHSDDHSYSEPSA